MTVTISKPSFILRDELNLLKGLGSKTLIEKAVGNISVSSLNIGTWTSEITHTCDFGVSTSNQKVKLYWPEGARIQGMVEITVASGYYYAQASGYVKKSYGLHVAENGAIYYQKQKREVLGNTNLSFHISDFIWDSTAKQWYVYISNLQGGNSGNSVTIHVKTVTNPVVSNPRWLNARASSTYLSPISTTDTTVYVALTNGWEGKTDIISNENVDLLGGTAWPESTLKLKDTSTYSTPGGAGLTFYRYRDSSTNEIVQAGIQARGVYGGNQLLNYHIATTNQGAQYLPSTPSVSMNGYGCIALNGGNISNAAGIAFPPSQIASTDPNTLDDYEEGTFTATIVGSTTAGTATYTNQTGLYIKIGGQVTVWFRADWSGHTGAGSILVGNLPFTASSAGGGPIYGMGTTTVYGSNNTQVLQIVSGANYLYVMNIPVGGGQDTQATMKTTGILLGTATYRV